MGSVRVRGVGAPEDGFIRYYAGEGNGEAEVTGCGASWRTSKVDGFREGRTKCQRAMMRLLLAVLRRPDVRTRTSTTPVWVGSVRVGDEGAPEDGFIRYYAGEGRGGFGDGLGCESGRSKVDGFRRETRKLRWTGETVLRRSVVVRNDSVFSFNYDSDT